MAYSDLQAKNAIDICKTIRSCNAVLQDDDVVYNFLVNDVLSNAKMGEGHKEEKLKLYDNFLTDSTTYYTMQESYHRIKLTY